MSEIGTTHTTTLNGHSVEITVAAWCGNVRPWRAWVKVNGQYIGKTGFTGGEGRCVEMGIKLAQKAINLRKVGAKG